MGLTIQEFLLEKLLPVYESPDPGFSPVAERLPDPEPPTGQRPWKAGMKAGVI